MKKEKGTIEVCISSVAISMVALLVILNMKLSSIKETRRFIEDGLVISNLASASINIKEYGETGNMIAEYDRSYNDFYRALKNNLQLDDNDICKRADIISGAIRIDKFIIYNVLGNDIEILYSNKNKEIVENGLGSVKTPDGITVETSTFYSKIAFDVKGFKNELVPTTKENTVGIKENKE